MSTQQLTPMSASLSKKGARTWRPRAELINAWWYLCQQIPFTSTSADCSGMWHPGSNR